MPAASDTGCGALRRKRLVALNSAHSGRAQPKQAPFMSA